VPASMQFDLFSYEISCSHLPSLIITTSLPVREVGNA
jgi:hypothetical protein